MFLMPPQSDREHSALKCEVLVLLVFWGCGHHSVATDLFGFSVELRVEGSIRFQTKSIIHNRSHMIPSVLHEEPDVLSSSGGGGM